MIWGHFPMEGIFFLTCSAKCVQPALPMTPERHFLSNLNVESSLRTSHLCKLSVPFPHLQSLPHQYALTENYKGELSSLWQKESFLEKDPSSTYWHFFCNTVDYPTFIKHFHLLIAHPTSYVMHIYWDKIQINFWITTPLIPLNVFLFKVAVIRLLETLCSRLYYYHTSFSFSYEKIIQQHALVIPLERSVLPHPMMLHLNL